MASNYLAKGLKRSALTVALGLCFAGGVQAQSTTGGIYGNVPAGSSVTISNTSGVSRTLTADAAGRYTASNLPTGTYTVASGSDKRTIVVTVGSNNNVSFGAKTLDTIVVSGSNVAPIDVTSVDTRTVLTQQQLNRLPMRRSAEAIALLAPGAIQSTARNFGGLISFGGAGVSENAYYVNGYFTGNPVSNLGGDALPYGVLDQQETYTGGYSAKYGRSDGGVISQIGKRGTNEWKFGGQITYSPQSLRSYRVDEYYPNLTGLINEANLNPNLPINPDPAANGAREQYAYTNAALPGTLYSRGKGNDRSTTTYSAYVGGPILKDRLFFFVGGEYSKTDSTATPANGAAQSSHSNNNAPRVYGKLDWNITSNHLLEYTFLGSKTHSEGDYYNYDFASGTEGTKQAAVVTPTNSRTIYHTLKYTGYLTDTLTLSAQYGRGDYTNDAINPAILPGVPYISGTTRQNPAIVGTNYIPNRQGDYTGVDSHSKTDGLRIDLEWVLGKHTLTAGIDDMSFKALSDGTAQVAPVFIYGKTATDTANISTKLGVGGPGPASCAGPKNGTGSNCGYYVRKYYYTDQYSSSLDQKAWYLEDRWQVTDNFLLSLGVRNDSFNNKNNASVTFAHGKNQWAPRLGFVWDIKGDSTFKVFGNAGRYYLSLPNSLARRGASASNFSSDYYTYTGIDSNGAPTGLTPVKGVNGGPAPGPVSANGELGFAPDVNSFAPKDLKYIYSDEYILGFESQLTKSWTMGAKLTSRSLQSSVDDFCDPDALIAAAGLTKLPYTYQGKFYAQSPSLGTVQISNCYMFNPGGTNTYSLPKASGTMLTGGYQNVTIKSSQLGFEGPVKRNYNALDLYLAHPFDGKWEGRIDYTFSKSTGNTEGQVKSEFGQADISKTQDWDSAILMRNSYGFMANDHRHQIKIRGSYAITPELLLGANLRIQDGMPISCLGYYNPDGSIDEANDVAADPISYGSSYHTCLGKIKTPGIARTPWTKTLDMGLTYTPAFLDKKMSVSLQVFNVFNEQKATQVDVTSEDNGYQVSNTYLMPGGAYGSRQTPRSMMLTLSYDY
jgi:outer membrane receptor protein involved in Fe transport